MKFIITGPESTGKTRLSEELSVYFKGISVPEYAREYISNLDRPYTYSDLVAIAEKQVEQMNKVYSEDCMVFFDTYLIITKVWFDHVFGKYPLWIDKEIEKTKNVLYLLCKPDIPWIPDRLRENGGSMRDILFHRYEEELSEANLNFCYIGGEGDDRLACAIEHVLHRNN